MNGSKKLLKIILDNLSDHKAQDIVNLDVRKLTDITDYMVICSATSSRHVQTLTKHLITGVKQQGIRPLGVEEDPAGNWNLIDLEDVIVNIMLPETREFYALEKLWRPNPKKTK